MKYWWESKTVWMNLATGLAAALALPEMNGVQSEDVGSIVGWVVG